MLLDTTELGLEESLKALISLVKGGWLNEYRTVLPIPLSRRLALFQSVPSGTHRGREHIPEGAAVICPNHTALSDPFLWLSPFRKRTLCG